MTDSNAGQRSSAADDGRRSIRRALVSVHDKDGLPELAAALHAAGVQIVSTGSTAAQIAATDVPVTQVEELTGFAEILGGRVKTLHPNIHAGLLADSRVSEHLSTIDQLGIEPFQLLISNLYPFRQTVASGATPDECVEQIDIGGPAMVRSAAKNHPSVAVVVDPADYAFVIAALAAGGFTLDQRKELARKAFAHTASYDVAVASWMGTVLSPDPAGFPAWTGASWVREHSLRYGENPHQPAALYKHWRPGLASAEQLHGKEMSYNNYVDVDAAWRVVNDFDDPAVAIMKHANPCGVAVIPGGDDARVTDAHARALACDPVSAFGGVIAVNRTVTVQLAEQISDIFT
ncbi:MAG: bifunctional phosphoribosylaminoimidazolecarboxamide formyltransferase/IMP cyclohydrolase, partial [Actinomycetota bacterium]|nr:bifunctional phosphoribosylaminoimidazolecarboxamide formyltransferase/IMP cyclohydrolase [Actinomycetota bacterium]